MTKRKASLKAILIGLVLIQLILVGSVALVAGTVNMRSGMEYEVRTGVSAACKSYAEMIELSSGMDDKAREGIEIDMHKSTGYEYTYFEGDTRARSSIPNVVGTKANDTVIETVLNGHKRYQADNVDIGGEKYYVAYEPIEEDGKVTGMAFVGKKKSEIMGYINKKVYTMVGIVVAIMILMLVYSVWNTLKIVNAIKDDVNAVKTIASGNLTIELDEKTLKRSDELGEMSQALLEMSDKLKSVIGNARHSSDEVDDSAGYLSKTATSISTTADGVSNAIEQVADGATNQAHALQDTLSNVGLINESIHTITENTEKMNEISASMQDKSKTSSESLTKLRMFTREVIASTDEIVELIKNTNNAVTTISEAVAIIDSIAAQTNLLSLNASIEAARAGEAGRGFAVVAGEIRELADQSAEAAANISDAMKGLSADSSNTMEKAGNVHETIIKQRSIIHQAIEQVDSLIESINSSIEITEEISKNVEQTDEASRVISDNISSLSSISQENAASSEQTRASMADLSDTVAKLSEKANGLNEIAKGLEEEMDFFKEE
ncbi:MAG: cache domain-containing protein [Lachnospiraceae bacterium]|nr:cache domain-containing protein [Lachnospiraceae bacterium]